MHGHTIVGVHITDHLLLETSGPEARVDALPDALRRLHGVQVQRMYFSDERGRGDGRGSR